jgi:hypothetical protein
MAPAAPISTGNGTIRLLLVILYSSCAIQHTIGVLIEHGLLAALDIQHSKPKPGLMRVCPTMRARKALRCEFRLDALGHYPAPI